MFGSIAAVGQSSAEQPADWPLTRGPKDCYPGQPRSIERPLPPPSASSTFGAVLTPKGNLRILVIFAGYAEEANIGYSSSYPGTTISLQNRADFVGSGELMAGARLVVRGTNTTLNGPASW